MNTKKIVLLSVFFVIAGIFLTGYIFADDDRSRQSSTEIEELKEEQKVLLEKIANLEAALNITEDPEDPEGPVVEVPGNEEDPEPVVPTPEDDKVLVAYVKDEHNAINARAEMGTSSPIVERVPQKSPMIILETKDDWYRVKLESGNIAWVASWVVRVQEE